MVTSSPLTPPQAIWDNAGTQKCVHTVRKAYPSDKISAYGSTIPASHATWMGVELACTDLALFATIAKAAGKHLTVSSFVQAGYGIRDAVIPGTNAPVLLRSWPAVRVGARCTWCTMTRVPSPSCSRRSRLQREIDDDTLPSFAHNGTLATASATRGSTARGRTTDAASAANAAAV